MFNWLSTLFHRRADDTLRPAPHLAAVAVHQARQWSDAPPAHLDLYAASSWVYVAVNRIAEAAALVPLHVYRLDGEQRVAVERHPLERLLDAPNPHTSRFELFEQTVGYLELTGNAYWFLGGEGGVPSEIWVLRPDRVTVVPDPVAHVRGYIYEVDGQRIPLEAVEVIHFKRWHPSSDYYGLSALEAARLAISSDRAMAEWNRNTFGQDNGVPAGIVNIKDSITDADFERIKREWRTTYGGPQRRTAFLRASAVEWQNIGLSHTDLDFLQGRRAHRDEILNIFGVPVGLVSENATEANAKVAERLFIERTLYPKLVRIAAKITAELLPFWSGELVAAFEDIRPTDAAVRLQELRAAYPVLTVNEIRARYYHLPPVAWGDLPASIKPTPSQGSPAPAETTLPTESPALPAETVEVKAVTTDSPLDELARWERFTLKRWGKAHARAFAVQAVPEAPAFEVAARLAAAATPDEVRTIFAEARGRLGEVKSDGV